MDLLTPSVILGLALLGIMLTDTILEILSMIMDKGRGNKRK